MFVLDTNVLSELMKESPHHNVVSWIGDVSPESIYTTAITMAELHCGVRSLPEGRRRNSLHASLGDIELLFAGKVLSFDHSCGQHFADIVVSRKNAGAPISAFDAQIAAICHLRDMSVVTRNKKDFEGFGLKVINPWE